MWQFRQIIEHSKLRLIYPKTKMPKNCTRLDIKTGASLRCEKVRKNQKRVCSPKEWGFIGPKPPRSILAKYDLKRGCFLLLKTGPKGSISPQNCLKGLWVTIQLQFYVFINCILISLYYLFLLKLLPNCFSPDKYQFLSWQ